MSLSAFLYCNLNSILMGFMIANSLVADVLQVQFRIDFNIFVNHTTRAKRRCDFHKKSSFSNRGFMKMQQLLSQLCQQEHYICILFLVLSSLSEYHEILSRKRCQRAGPEILTFFIAISDHIL